MYNSDKEVEKLCFSIRQTLKSSLDTEATFIYPVGFYNISLEFVNQKDLVLQVTKNNDRKETDYKLPLSKAIYDYYDIEKSIATLIYQYNTLYFSA
jgi:translation elongation factor EF-4